MKTRKIRQEVVISYIKLFFNIIIGFLILPYTIKYIGSNNYGIMTLVNSMVGYIGILDLGIGQTIVRYIAIYNSKNEKEKQNQLVSYSLCVYVALSIIGVVIGLVVYIKFGTIYKSLTGDSLLLAKYTFLIGLANILLQIPFAAFTSVLSGYNKFNLLNITQLGKLFVRTIVVVVLLRLRYGLFSIFITDFIVNQVVNLYYVYYVAHKIKIKFGFFKMPAEIKAELRKYSFFVFLGILTDQIFWRTDNILLGIFNTTSAIAVYSISSTLVSYFISICSNFSSVFLPKLTSMSLDDKNNVKTNEFFIMASRYQFMIVIIMVVNYIFLGKDFITLWLGPSFINAYYYGIIIIVPLVVPMFQTTGFQILYARNRHSVRSIIYLFNAVFNIFTSIYFIKKYGAIGAAMGTGLSMFLGNVIFINIYYKLELKLSLRRFFYRVCTKTLISLIPGVFVIILLDMTNLRNINLFNFMSKALIFNSIFMIGVYFISFNYKEKIIINNIFNKVLSCFVKNKIE